VTVEVRPAATVMLVRDTPDERVEVLLLQRHPDLVFVAGAHVFPGGAVDPADRTEASAAVATGLDDATASVRLGVPAGGLAYWIAAVRETFEEAGLLVATTPEGDDPWLDPHRAERLHDARPDIEAGRVTLAELCRREGLRLDLGLLRSFGRWITPLGAPRRYDTRFFVAPAPRRPEVRVDEREAVAAEWVEPATALERFREGEIDLILPTERSLAALAEHRTTADLFGWLDTGPAEVDDHGGRRVGSPGRGPAPGSPGPVNAPLPVGDP
jgi:8-oxo-dGTP pyrophosphatase MutT (NUDIX family)